MTKQIAFVIFAIVALYLQSSKADDKPAGYAECVSKSGVVEADITVRPRKDSTELKCFYKCMLEKAGFIEASGNTVTAKFESSFPKATAALDAKVVADIKTCIAAGGQIHTCDDMALIRDCFGKSMKS